MAHAYTRAGRAHASVLSHPPLAAIAAGGFLHGSIDVLALKLPRQNLHSPHMGDG